MITKEQILKSQQDFEEAWKPINQKQNEFFIAITKELDDASKPLRELLSNYYNQELIDSLGAVIKQDDTIMHDDGTTYTVLERTMKISKEKIIFNPHLIVREIRKFYIEPVKTKKIFRKDLKNYTVIVKL